MNYNQAYNAYNSALANNLRQEIFHGGCNKYHQAICRTALQNLERRFHDLLRALCVWRGEAEYPAAIKTKMLTLLSNGLLTARQAALAAWVLAGDITLLGDRSNGAADQHNIG